MLAFHAAADYAHIMYISIPPKFAVSDQRYLILAISTAVA
jgi:hypothetical protein